MHKITLASLLVNKKNQNRQSDSAKKDCGVNHSPSLSVLLFLKIIPGSSECHLSGDLLIKYQINLALFRLYVKIEILKFVLFLF